ncbi:MAG: hypothetical protein DIZ78_09510 [endosymbiont of Escarpia spicata]|uniref:Novel toxin 16 domain-containing protein n=1 Tax=endosymbiont of Escarpia spicata TaxID=2200908 RepID=A0A370DQH0_9GAMM|nr:MAG: hypothetical protein DIZ78_09510 [endosymbiont of Escarpia spicata]
MAFMVLGSVLLTGIGASTSDGEEGGSRTAPGDCSPEQKLELQNYVNECCKRGKRACNANQTCDELKANYCKNKRCAEARKNINEACYDGGDEGHKEALCQTRAAITKCVNIMVSENKKCITAKCEPPECNDQEGD